jgi:hypothetical protein
VIGAKKFSEKHCPRALGLDLRDLDVMTGLRQSGIPYVSLWKSVTLTFKYLVVEARDNLDWLLQRSLWNATWAACKTWSNQPFWLLSVYCARAGCGAVYGVGFYCFYK